MVFKGMLANPQRVLDILREDGRDQSFHECSDIDVESHDHQKAVEVSYDDLLVLGVVSDEVGQEGDDVFEQFLMLEWHVVDLE